MMFNVLSLALKAWFWTDAVVFWDMAANAPADGQGVILYFSPHTKSLKTTPHVGYRCFMLQREQRAQHFLDYFMSQK